MLLFLCHLVSSLSIIYGIPDGYHEIPLEQGETLSITNEIKILVMNYEELGITGVDSNGLEFLNTFDYKVVVQMMVYTMKKGSTYFTGFYYHHMYSKPTNLYFDNSDKKKFTVHFDFQRKMVENSVDTYYGRDIYLPGVTHYYLYGDFFESVDSLPNSFRLHFSGTYLITIGTSSKTIYVERSSIIVIIRNDVQTEYQKIITGVTSITFPAGNADSCVQLIYANFNEESSYSYTYDIIHNPKDLEIGYYAKNNQRYANLIIYSDSSMFVSVENLCTGKKDEWMLPKNEAFIYTINLNEQIKVRADSLDKSLTSELFDHSKPKFITSLTENIKYPYDICNLSETNFYFCNVSTKKTYLCDSVQTGILNPSLFDFNSPLVSSKSGTNELVAINYYSGDDVIVNDFGTFKSSNSEKLWAFSTIPIACAASGYSLKTYYNNGLYGCRSDSGNVTVLKANIEENVTRSLNIQTDTNNIEAVDDFVYLAGGINSLEINGTLNISFKGILFIPNMTDLEIVDSSVEPKYEGYYFDSQNIASIQIRSKKLVKFKIFCIWEDEPLPICYNVPTGNYNFSSKLIFASEFQFHTSRTKFDYKYYHTFEEDRYITYLRMMNYKIPVDYKYKCFGISLEGENKHFSEELTNDTSTHIDKKLFIII